MQAILELEATVSSKGQITLPAAMRARLGLVEGSKIKFFCGDKEATLKPELPVNLDRKQGSFPVRVSSLERRPPLPPDLLAAG